MALGITAIVVSVLAAAFTGIMAVLASREQRFRLRPYVYIDRIDTHASSESIVWRLAIKNIGLLPAKDVRISPLLSTDGPSRGLDKDEEYSKAIIVPQQVIWNSVGIKGETKQRVIQGKTKLKMDVNVNYEGMGKKYYYKAHYTYNVVTSHWVFDEGNAN